jgi:hypothetical protein
MESPSVLEAGFRLDDLRVEELEPRLEFVTYACDTTSGPCSVCYVFGDGDGDFLPLLDSWFCGT